MIEALTHPGLILIAGAAVIAPLRGRIRAAIALALPLGALMLVLSSGDGGRWTGELAGLGVTPFASDALSRLFGTIFALMAFGGVLFGLNQTNRMELPAALLYAGAALGVTFAGDLFTVFVFWELMAIGSTLVIWSAATRGAYRASMRYLSIHLLGGTLLLLGIASHYLESSSLAFGVLSSAPSPGYWLILGAFLINAAAPPLSAWLPDAYPEASWSGTVFLSAFTTKVAVYVLLRAYPGTELLIWIGLYMIFYGIVYALIESDMRRVLAYSIVNQVGFMVTAIGIGTELALNGAAAQAFTHILYKALLLMAAGSVIHATGRHRIADAGGLARSMPLTAACCIVGALAISAVPLTSGFVSKSMIVQAAAERHWLTVWLLLTAASAGSVLYVGRFVRMVFFGGDSGLRPADPPHAMRAAMLVFAALSIALGVFHEPLYRMLPFPVDYMPYTGWHVVAQLQLVLFSALALLLFLPFLRRTQTITLDVDWLYRRALPRIASTIESVWDATTATWRASRNRLGMRMIVHVRRMHGPQGILARTWSTRSMGMWMLVMLLGVLLIGYIG